MVPTYSVNCGRSMNQGKSPFEGSNDIFMEKISVAQSCQFIIIQIVDTFLSSLPARSSQVFLSRLLAHSSISQRAFTLSIVSSFVLSALSFHNITLKDDSVHFLRQ